KGKLRVENSYCTQGECNRHPVKYPLKAKFYADLYHYLSQHLQQQPLIAVMGDFNICPDDTDIGISESAQQRWLRTGVCSFLPEERVWMQRLFSLELVDTFRQHYPHCTDKFSCFDYRTKGFNNNTGLRIDLILASASLAAYCRDAGIDYTIRAMEKPSDHAPVWAEFAL